MSNVYKITPQIYYTHYNQTLPTEHMNYFSCIDDIARLISMALEGCFTTTHFTGKVVKAEGIYKTNSIVVNQWKEKFGCVVVYWTAAVPEYVEELHKQYHIKESLEDYREKMYIQDHIHYRNIYFMFRDLFPQYWRAIYNGAESPHMLYDTPQEYLEAMKTNKNLEYYKDEVFNILSWKDV